MPPGWSCIIAPEFARGECLWFESGSGLLNLLESRLHHMLAPIPKRMSQRQKFQKLCRTTAPKEGSSCLRPFYEGSAHANSELHPRRSFPIAVLLQRRAERQSTQSFCTPCRMPKGSRRGRQSGCSAVLQQGALRSGLLNSCSAYVIFGNSDMRGAKPADREVLERHAGCSQHRFEDASKAWIWLCFRRPAPPLPEEQEPEAGQRFI